MKITDDILEFTTADFDGFSDAAKKALSGYLEDYATYFASVINVSVTAAKQHAKNLAAQAPTVDTVLASYAAADEAKRASAESLLTDLDNHLKS